MCFLFPAGEDRWLCTLLLKQGWRVEYNAASDAYTNAPEDFKELYNQVSATADQNLSTNIMMAMKSPQTSDKLIYLHLIFRISGIWGSHWVQVVIKSKITSVMLMIICHLQRRRWGPSTMANVVDLLGAANIISKRNSSMSKPFMLYQLFAITSAILAPATICLLIAGCFFVFDNRFSAHTTLCELLRATRLHWTYDYLTNMSTVFKWMQK